MITKKTIYCSDIDKYGKSDELIEFETLKEAQEYENEIKLKNKIDKLMSMLRKYFKHKETNKYLIRCEDCGELLLEYECYSDGHRNEKGDIIFDAQKGVNLLFDGDYCNECYNKKFDLLLKICPNKEIVSYILKNKDAMLYTHKIDKDIFLKILKAIEKYDKKIDNKKI